MRDKSSQMEEAWSRVCCHSLPPPLDEARSNIYFANPLKLVIVCFSSYPTLTNTPLGMLERLPEESL